MTPPPSSSTLFPYTTLFRSSRQQSADLPIFDLGFSSVRKFEFCFNIKSIVFDSDGKRFPAGKTHRIWKDRKSTRLNSSHGYISYAVFCLKKKISDQESQGRH